MLLERGVYFVYCKDFSFIRTLYSSLCIAPIFKQDLEVEGGRCLLERGVY